jgi:Cu2+-exporting ATPase
LHFEDRPWSDAATEIEALKKKGFLISILSGDKVDKVQRAARTLGIENEAAIGDASPQMKQQWLHEHNGSSTLILGDGANDSLAFDEALCCGTPAAEKTTLASKADFYYLGAGIQGVRSLFDIASKRRSAIRALMAFALTYNFATISLALAGIVTPLLAAILMPLSSIVSIGIVWAILRT